MLAQAVIKQEISKARFIARLPPLDTNAKDANLGCRSADVIPMRRMRLLYRTLRRRVYLKKSLRLADPARQMCAWKGPFAPAYVDDKS
jgi:hypothetical protein